MRRGPVRKLSYCAAAAFVLSCVAGEATAQYSEPVRTYSPSEVRFFDGGIFAREFSPRPGNTEPESLAVSYRCVMPLVGFRQGPVDFLFGYTTYDQHGVSCAGIFFGATFTGEYLLAGSREQALILPFLVAGDFTKSESAGGLHDNFNVGSIGVGTGLKYRMSGESVDLSLLAAGLIHYSFDGYGLDTGSSPAAVGEVLVLLPDVGVLNGLALGYRFRYQSWNFGNGRYDYKTVNNGVFVGVMF